MSTYLSMERTSTSVPLTSTPDQPDRSKVIYVGTSTPDVTRREALDLLKLSGYPENDQGPKNLETLEKQAAVIRTLMTDLDHVHGSHPLVPRLYNALYELDVMGKEGQRLIKKTEQVNEALHQTTYSTAWRFPPAHEASSADNGASTSPACLISPHQGNMLHGVYRPTFRSVKATLEMMSLYEKKLDIITRFNRDVRLHFEEFKHKAALMSMDLSMSEHNSRYIDDKIARADHEIAKLNEQAAATTSTAPRQAGAGVGSSQDIPPPSHSPQPQPRAGEGSSQSVPAPPHRLQLQSSAGVGRPQSVPPRLFGYEISRSGEESKNSEESELPGQFVFFELSQEIHPSAEGSEDSEEYEPQEEVEVPENEGKGKDKVAASVPKNTTKRKKVVKSRRKGKRR
ncbi:hypothetical protein DL546_000243 [Coniochaeta pulveracea]|uniref:Uncharacterized protein n=1 Tax=Coniochaeta pulveracea TaxID=177199 RepID=A0A420Y6U4_9PEZI|nr:hypothetical protein DL546_000243 [Coniochaeta pulveracea]